MGGALTDAAGWRSIFWINVPIGILAIVLVARVVPESRAARPRRLDPVGQVLAMVFLAALTYAIIEGGDAGWGSPRVQVSAILAAASIIGFVAHERRAPEPLIDLRFFRSVPFTGATLTAIAAFIALGGFLLVTNLYLQVDRGLSPVHSGLYTLPMAALAFVAAPLSGRIVGRRGARVPLVVGGLGLAGGSLILTQLTPTTATADLLLAYSVFGLGFGMVNPPITNTAVSGMPADQAGVAAAVASTSRLVGISLGVAIIGSIVVSSRKPAAAASPRRAIPAGGSAWRAGSWSSRWRASRRPSERWTPPASWRPLPPCKRTTVSFLLREMQPLKRRTVLESRAAPAAAPIPKALRRQRSLGAREGPPDHLPVSHQGRCHIACSTGTPPSVPVMRRCMTPRSPDPRMSSRSHRTSSKAPRTVCHQARTPSWPRKVVPSASATNEVNSHPRRSPPETPSIARVQRPNGSLCQCTLLGARFQHRPPSIGRPGLAV